MGRKRKTDLNSKIKPSLLRIATDWVFSVGLYQLNRKRCHQADGNQNDGIGKVIDIAVALAGLTVIEVDQNERNGR